MKEVPNGKFQMAVSPGHVVLLAVAAGVIYKAAHPISHTEIIMATASVALGALLGCLPFLLDYRATGN